MVDLGGVRVMEAIGAKAVIDREMEAIGECSLWPDFQKIVLVYIENSKIGKLDFSYPKPLR